MNTSKEGNHDEVEFCPGCGKSDCEAPPLVQGYVGDGCGFDQSAFEDDCGDQIKMRGRPAIRYKYLNLEKGESRFKPLGIIGREDN